MLIAQISDIHASAENDHLLRFKQVLRWLKHVSPDVLVISGDLTDGCWLEGYQQIAAHLRQQNYPSLVLPGNSDDLLLMRSFWNDTQWAHNVGSLRLIGLDSTVTGKGYGSLIDRIDWLHKQLNSAEGRPVLLFMHHHIFESGIPTLDKLMCRDIGKLEEQISQTPARVLAICSGHVHRPIAGTFAGVPAYICGSICPANPLWFGTGSVPPVQEPPALMIHRYVNNELSSHHIGIREYR